MNQSGNGDRIVVEAQYLYRKALEWSGKGNHEAAMNYLRQAVMIAPRFSKAFNEMGNCLCSLGREREAIAKYEKAIAIDPDFTEACRNRNAALEKLGRKKR